MSNLRRAVILKFKTALQASATFERECSWKDLYKSLHLKVNFHRTDKSSDARHAPLLAIVLPNHLKNVSDILPISRQLGEELNLKVRLDFSQTKLLFYAENLHDVLRQTLSEISDENYISDDKCEHRDVKGPVVIDFSSPNVAKFLHAGHLRSTILGKFIANLYSAMNHEVIRVNYIGDWGMQVGKLTAGFQKFGSKGELTKNPLQHLYDVYAKTHAYLVDENVPDEEKEAFLTLAVNNPLSTELWKTMRKESLKHYKDIYDRLGVKFDLYLYESDFEAGACALENKVSGLPCASYNEKGDLLLHFDKSITPHWPEDTFAFNRTGKSSYVSRDVASLIQRQDEFNPSRVHYVTSRAQMQHFRRVTLTCRLLGLLWAHAYDDRNSDLVHVSFGEIKGMKSRTGSVVTLEDLLHKVTEGIKENMLATPTTKVTGDELDRVAHDMAVTSLVIQDFRNRRSRDYEFSWRHVMQLTGRDTGAALQYTHARLCSLERKVDVVVAPDTECDVTLLSEPEAQRLVLHLAAFSEHLNVALDDLEPCHVTQYLFRLIDLTNQAWAVLPVASAEPEVRRARLTMFRSARRVVARGLQVLGVPPLERI